MILKPGDMAMGNNYAEMINDAIGTKFKRHQKCTVDLANPDYPEKTDIRAWFVYMDGSVHGFPDGWLWRNIISPNGKSIKEYNVSPDTTLLKARQNNEGYYPYRLCFQIDPNGMGNKYWCRYVGAFRFSRFLCSDLSAVEYVKVFDEGRIAAINYGLIAALNSKEDFLVGADSYKIPIAEMNFSPGVFQLLSMSGIATAGDLLELGIGTNSGIAVEIRKKLYEYFH